MAFTLDQVVPWGRNFDEYQHMFSLSKTDLGTRILGCGDGPASFNKEARAKGVTVTSVDPIYRFNAEQIHQRIETVRPEIMAKTKSHAHQFLWNYFENPDALEHARMDAMQQFLTDFDSGKKEGRYVEGSLPSLPFKDQSFDLGLVSHFLFLYTALKDLTFHKASILELLRICKEVRIFPLQDLNVQQSSHLEPIIENFRDLAETKIMTVDYEFQAGGNKMLVLRNHN